MKISNLTIDTVQQASSSRLAESLWATDPSAGPTAELPCGNDKGVCPPGWVLDNRSWRTLDNARDTMDWGESPMPRLKKV